MGNVSPKSFSAEALSADNTNSNPINEVQVLEGHSDIVRFLLAVGPDRFVSASDDGTAILWSNNGNCISVLKGHSKPITCLMLLNPNTLVSGSADKTIKVWDLGAKVSNKCKHTLHAHSGSVKCLELLARGRFASGGNDDKICIWNSDGTLQGCIERKEEENLHCMLFVRKRGRLVTGSNSSLLLVYDVNSLNFDRLLAYHRESIRCLTRVSDDMFVSASLDGGIVLWQAETLTPSKILFYPEKYRNESRMYIHCVHSLLVVQNYLVAAIGHGFRIYDMKSGLCLVENANAHLSDVLDLALLYDGTRLVTCSADSSIRLWEYRSGASSGQNESQEINLLSMSHGKLRGSSLKATCLGDMVAHSDAVHSVISLSETSFASCSADGLVILWKDGRVQEEFRNRMATRSLQKQPLPHSLSFDD